MLRRILRVSLRAALGCRDFANLPMIGLATKRLGPNLPSVVANHSMSDQEKLPRKGIPQSPHNLKRVQT